MRIVAASAVLVAVFVAALLVGRAGGDSAENAAASAEVKAIKLPDEATRAPRVEDPGAIPDLKPKPQVTSTPTTGSTPTADVQTSTPSTGTTTPSSGGGGGGGDPTPTARPPG
jgi:hypothetical protein